MRLLAPTTTSRSRVGYRPLPALPYPCRGRAASSVVSSAASARTRSAQAPVRTAPPTRWCAPLARSLMLDEGTCRYSGIERSFLLVESAKDTVLMGMVRELLPVHVRDVQVVVDAP